MKRQHEFFFDKEKTRKSLIIKFLGFIFIISCFLYLEYKEVVNLWTIFFFILGILFWLYFTLKTWKEYNYIEPALIVNEKSLIFIKINHFLKFTETEIRVDEIKAIGTDIKMEREVVKSKLLNLKMQNSDELTFDIDILGLTHDDLYKLIKELKPEAKLLNIGEFAYDN